MGRSIHRETCVPAQAPIDLVERPVAHRRLGSGQRRDHIGLAHARIQRRGEVAQRPTARRQQFPGRIVAAEDSADRFDAGGFPAMLQPRFGSDRAQLLADPGVDRRRGKRPGTCPADSGVLLRDRRKERTRLHRPAPGRGRDGTVVEIGVQHAERRRLSLQVLHLRRSRKRGRHLPTCRECGIRRRKPVATAETRLAEASVVPTGLLARPSSAHVEITVHGEVLRRRRCRDRAACERHGRMQASDMGARHAQRRLGIASTKREKSCTGSALDIRKPCAWSQPMLDRYASVAASPTPSAVTRQPR